MGRLLAVWVPFERLGDALRRFVPYLVTYLGRFEPAFPYLSTYAPDAHVLGRASGDP